MKTVLILSVSSDIGLELAKRYLADGYAVVGTYRAYGRLDEIAPHPHCHLFACDVSSKKSIKRFLSAYKRLHIPWETFIACVGDPRPLTPFFAGDFDQWSQSVHTNAIEQLRVLHGAYPLRVRTGIPTIAFFTAGGVMQPVQNLSAYTVSKILLVKLSEFLSAENPDLNIFTVSPGWTKTKIHTLILNDPQVSEEKHGITEKFLAEKTGTSMQDVYDCIRWACKQKRSVVSGRNFFIPEDPWKGKHQDALVRALEQNPDMYTLRRHNNEFGRS